jgi:FlaA1/EpsC-like NDP-sugar epimerase
MGTDREETSESFLDRVISYAQRHRRIVAAFVYTGITTCALGFAYLIHSDFNPESLLNWPFSQALLVLLLIRLGINYLFSLGLGRWRYVGIRDFGRLLVATTVGSIVFFVLMNWSFDAFGSVPVSIVLLEWVFTGYMTGGVWVMYRVLYEVTRVRQGAKQRRVLVLGAGEAAQMLIAQMLRSSAGYLPVGILDDDETKKGTRIHGVKVFGPTRDLDEVCSKLDVEEIIIGIPSATSAELRAIMKYSELVDLPLKILPGIDDVLHGDPSLSQVRGLELEDLLGRDPVQLALPELAEAIRDQNVLVTGAAGSIGSELARQIAINSPRTLILYDQAETPLYYLELELLDLAPDLEIVPIVASVTDQNAVTQVFETYRPQKVYHAAAYKHVPLMEQNPRSAALTNILGTYLVGLAAARAGAQTFVLVSTDKAVRPTNVMGATKQAAERVVLHLQEQYPDTSFGAVRFGNVLGSSGSVIPLFERQLGRGEPLTLTDENITRYFMTIPEAVQLILKASLLGSFPGHVVMLDMGKPVRILDLARNMLRLSGRPFRLGENVIVTGLRPGEKMHEELSAPNETVCATQERRVFLVETPKGFSEMPYQLRVSLENGDAVGLLNFLATEFVSERGSRPVALEGLGSSLASLGSITEAGG